MVYRESFKLESRHRAVSFHDITDKVKEISAKCNIKDGIVVVYSHHTTCWRVSSPVIDISKAHS